MGKYRKPLFVLLVISIFLLFDNVSAATLTSYSSEYDSCSASNKFTYTNIDTNGNWYYYTGTIGSVINNSPNSMQFDFKYDLTASKYYDVVFTMNGFDIYSSVDSSIVSVLNGSSCGSTTNNNIALVSFTKSNYNSTYKGYKTMTFRIYAATLISNWSIILESTSPIAGPNNFGVSSITINEVDLSNTDAIIGNQNSNTDAIIGNQNNNTNTITNNQNQNTQDIIDNQNELLGSKCSNLFNKNDITTGFTFTNSGSTSPLVNSFIGNSFIKVDKSNTITISIGTNTNFTSETDYRLIIMEYDNNYSFIKRTLFQSRIGTLNLSNNTSYIKIGASTITKDELMVNYGSLKPYCEYGSYLSKLDDVSSGVNNIDGTLNDSNVDSNVGTGFFNDFNDEDFGLSDIITIPLNTITSLTSKSCQPLSIPIPKTGKNINLPCMTQVYEDNIGTIFTIWQVVSFGIIAYFIAIDIFHLVKGFKDPESDKVEVLDL